MKPLRRRTLLTTALALPTTAALAQAGGGRVWSLAVVPQFPPA